MSGTRQSFSSRKEAAEMSAPSTHQVPSEQHDAEIWAAENFQFSLRTIDKVAKELEDSFAIGGCETIAQPVLLVHKSQDAEKKSDALELPAQGADEGALEDLMAACSVADRLSPIGTATEEVPGTGFKKALELDTENFDLDLNIEETSLLTHIKEIMAPDAIELCAELYQLNIYKPGDFSKACVDTPRSKYTVGTLVIALPSIHKGGALRVRHRKREQVFDWSLTALPHEPRVQWAAFYSDCEHEVQKVESGVCITVVYNLMTSPTPAPYLKAMNARCVSLLICMKHELAHPAFFGRGGTLRIPCQHMYPDIRNKAFVSTDGQPHLKGADACTVAMAHFLGLDLGVTLLPDAGPSRNVTSHCQREEVQVHIKDGDDDSPPVLVYTHAAIDVHVPPWSVRKYADHGALGTNDDRKTVYNSRALERAIAD